MSLVWPEDEAWQELAAAVEPGIAALISDVRFRIEAGSPEDPLMRLTAEGLALGPALLGPGMREDDDETWFSAQEPAVANLALDRWRRTTGLILEALELHAIAGRLSMAPEALPLTWWSVGRAAEWVDRELPALGWIWCEAVDLLGRPEEGLDHAPRRGAWFFRWLLLEGRSMPELTESGIALDMDTWMEFGAWCRSRGRGPASLCPVPIPRAPHVYRAQSWSAPALSIHPVLLRAGATGLRPICEGGALSSDVPLRADEERAALVGVLEESTVRLRDLKSGPTGTWELVSGGMGSSIGSGRGVDMTLLEDGRLDFVLANAFLGLMEGRILALAEKFGVSGECPGRWRVLEMAEDGRSGTLMMEDLDPTGLSVHPRASAMFALPAKTWMEPVRRALTQLEDQPLEFSMDPDLDGVDLLIRAEIRGSAAELRFRRGDANPEQESE